MVNQSIAKAFRSVFVPHDPNLNLLGTRKSEVYGVTALADINAALAERVAAHGVTLAHFQSNHEDASVDHIHVAKGEDTELIIINPAAYTHTSAALRDAPADVAIPYVGVHLSNVHCRRPFRHRSYLIDRAVGMIYGLGWRGYLTTLDFAVDQCSG